MLGNQLPGLNVTANNTKWHICPMAKALKALTEVIKLKVLWDSTCTTTLHLRAKLKMVLQNEKTE